MIFLGSKNLSIVFEWPVNPKIKLDKLCSVVTLCCISSLYGECNYNWVNLKTPHYSYIETPVLYVNKPGLYQCEVSTDSSSVVSKVFEISVLPGELKKRKILES